MTKDELEAYRAMLGVMDNRSLGNALRDKLPGILDEVERLRSRAAPDPCEAQVPFDTPDGVTWFPAPLGSADPFDRATRAEAHAERLAGALADVQNPACLMMCPDVWPDDTDQPHTIACTNARSALAAYRGVKDEACSRPSDALDAPVADQSTTCSQPERITR